MSTRSESGKTNLVAIAVLVGFVITGVWVWKRLSFDTQDYVIDQAVPMAFAGLVIAAGLFMLVRAFNRRRTRRRERAKLLAAFEQATVQEKRLEIAFALIDVNGYRGDGLESVTPALRDLFSMTLQREKGKREKGTGYLIGRLPASRAVSRIARIRRSAAPLRTLFLLCSSPDAIADENRVQCANYFSLSDALEEPWRYFDGPS